MRIVSRRWASSAFRCIATGVRFGAQFFDAADPWAVNRPLDDKRFSLITSSRLLKLPRTFPDCRRGQEGKERSGE
jgi:hypothetical protein